MEKSNKANSSLGVKLFHPRGGKKLIEALFFAYLVFYPFGQLTRIPLPAFIPAEVHLYLGELILFFLLLFWLIWRSRSGKKLVFPVLARPMSFFILAAAISLLAATPRFPVKEWLVSGAYLWRFILYVGLYFFLVDRRQPHLQNILLILGSAVGIFGLIQYLFWPNLRALEALGWDPHSYRVVGTFLDPGFIGIILTLTGLLYFNRLTSDGGPKGLLRGGSWWEVAGVAAVFLALIFTYSRASWLALVTGVTVMSILKQRFRTLLIFAAIVIIVLIFLPQPAGEGGKIARTYSAVSRLENWQSSLELASQHPFFGVGFNTLRYVRDDFESRAGAGVDSSLLFVLATTGIVGLIAFLWIGIKALKIYAREKSSVWPIFAALFVHSWFLNSLFYPAVLGWLAIYLASRENK